MEILAHDVQCALRTMRRSLGFTAVIVVSLAQHVTLPLEATFSIAVAAATMVGVALLAASLPARRAARVQPMDGLRHT